jgi:hypothetical protein
MSIAKRIGWILIGVVIGGLATGSMSAVREQQRQASPGRLAFVDVSSGNFGAVAAFVKDTKSTGCWLAMSKGDSGVSLVTAPPEACY